MKQITKDTVLKQGDKSFEQFLAENPYKHTRSFIEADWEADMYEKWKETIKTYTAIEVDVAAETAGDNVWYNKGIVWVDKDAAIFKNTAVTNGRDIFKPCDFPEYSLEYANTYWEEVIAANFELEGVPKIELESEGILCLKAFNNILDIDNHEYERGLFNGWLHCYKANQAKYTEEDMIGLVRYVADVYRNPTDKTTPIKLVQEYLQSINSIKEITVDENFKPI